MADPLVALQLSVSRLAALLDTLSEDQLTAPAYPAQWSVAQVLSHLGSAAVIFGDRLRAALSGTPSPDGIAEGVWDEWNAKSPVAQARDARSADADYLAALKAVDASARESVVVELGPLRMDFRGFVQIRLNEHALHSWDVAVSVDPAATVAAESVEFVIDQVQMIAAWTAKPSGEPGVIAIRTVGPDRGFTVTTSGDGVQLAAADVVTPDLTMPAEAFVRLVYGRLDAAHTPGGITGDPGLLDTLRATFPGP
jgi:uncharacterized protein (TIGR03083 family)